MIQRIQSILLLLASGAMGALFTPFMSFAKMIRGQSDAPELSDGQFTVTDNTVLIAITVIATIGFLIALFLFRNRKLQVNIAQFSALLSVCLLGYAYFLFSKIVPSIKSVNIDAISSGINIGYGIGIAAPILAVILSIIAIRFIRKDENLVRSADRLR